MPEIDLTGLRRPHFHRPPVIEVVCGVQFRSLKDWLTSHYGSYWAEINRDYPATEDQPPLARIRLDDQSGGGDEMHLTALPPLRRVFYIAVPANFLIQVQPDRFLHNWRKMNDQDQYPRFDTAYAKFVQQWTRFQSFVQAAKLGVIAPEMFELTYVNHIVAEADSSFPRDVWKYLSFYNRNPLSDPAFEPSAMSLNFVWPLRKSAGTLSMNVKHGRRLIDSRELLLVEFTARGAARPETEMSDWFDVAHDAVVNSFDKLTTEDGHVLWGKTS